MAITLTLRPATTADGAFAFHVWKAAMEAYVDMAWGWDETWQRQNQQKEFVSRLHKIIEARGQPIGTLITEYASDHLYLAGLYLLPEYQRQGYGSCVLERLLAEAQAQYLPVRLRVLKVNPLARRLYERAGFIPVGEEEVFTIMEVSP